MQFKTNKFSNKITFEHLSSFVDNQSLAFNPEAQYCILFKNDQVESQHRNL